MKSVPSVYEFRKEGLTLRQAVMARETMASSMIAGANPMSAKKMVELMKEEEKLFKKLKSKER